MTAPQREGVAAFGRSPGAEASTRAQRLARDAAEAAELRTHLTHPDVVALRVERVRGQIDRMCWSGIMLGLAFTMTNVQAFAAAGAPALSLPWLAAWLLDPMVALILLAILRAEQVTARYQVRSGPWVRFAKWFTLACTYVMNTWQSFASGSLSSIVLHSVPPLVVFTAAEAITDLRDKLTEAVSVAFMEAAQRAALTDPGPPQTDRRKTKGRPARRTLFADYLAAARAAWNPAVTVTPAWVREATGCSRGLSPQVAAALKAELPTTRRREEDVHER